MTSNSDTIIRKAIPQDVSGVLSVEKHSFANPGERFHLRQIQRLIANPNAETFVAEGHDDLLGHEILGWVSGLVRRQAIRSGEGVSPSRAAAVSAAEAAEKTRAGCPRDARAGRPRHVLSGRVYAVAVLPEARGLSLGRRLMEQVLAALRGRGAGRIFLEVRSDNVAAINLYRKLGFRNRRAIRDYYGTGLDALGMVLEESQ